MARVARNAVIDEMRRRVGPPLGDVAEVPPPDLERSERVREAVRTAILGLRSPYREAMLLRYVEGWSYRRVVRHLAETRQIHVSGARQVLHRAREMIRGPLARVLGLPLRRKGSRESRRFRNFL